MSWDKMTAIKAIYPEAVCTVNNETEIVWQDGNPKNITEEQIESKQQELKTKYVLMQNRIKEYGSMAEQLEYIVENGLDAFITKQNGIKSKYPKE
jgi:predicted transcriptional regulator